MIVGCWREWHANDKSHDLKRPTALRCQCQCKARHWLCLIAGRKALLLSGLAVAAHAGPAVCTCARVCARVRVWVWWRVLHSQFQY
jgi:hypothetical protein